MAADARGAATSGLATIKEREVGALFFLEVRQGNDERGVDVIPVVEDVVGPEERNRTVKLLKETLLP